MSPAKPAKLIAMPATVRKNASSITAGRVTGPRDQVDHLRGDARSSTWESARDETLTLAGHPCDDPDLDEETLARHRGLHRGARRPVVREVATVRVVERVEVGRRAQEDERVERVRERRASLLEYRADVVEDAARLRRDVATARLVGLRIERDLPRDEHEVAVAERVRVRQTGVRRSRGLANILLRAASLPRQVSVRLL